MEIILYIYFGVNIFLSGYWFNENDRWENRRYAIIFSVVCLLIGAILAVFVPLFYLVLPIFECIKYEIKFWYRVKCTDYWDKILLDDTYSEDYKSREEKLERIKNLANNFNKQSKRHSKIIYNKYK